MPCLIVCVALSLHLQMGDTALHLACTRGYIDIARVLILKGASIDQIDEVRLHFVHPKTML